MSSVSNKPHGCIGALTKRLGWRRPKMVFWLLPLWLFCMAGHVAAAHDELDALIAMVQIGDPAIEQYELDQSAEQFSVRKLLGNDPTTVEYRIEGNVLILLNNFLDQQANDPCAGGWVGRKFTDGGLMVRCRKSSLLQVAYNENTALQNAIQALIQYLSQADGTIGQLNFHCDRLVAVIRECISKNSALQYALQASEQERVQAGNVINNLQVALSNAKSKIGHMKREAKATQRENTQLEQDTEASNRKIAELESTIVSLEKELERAQQNRVESVPDTEGGYQHHKNNDSGNFSGDELTPPKENNPADNAGNIATVVVVAPGPDEQSNTDIDDNLLRLLMSFFTTVFNIVKMPTACLALFSSAAGEKSAEQLPSIKEKKKKRKKQSKKRNNDDQQTSKSRFILGLFYGWRNQEGRIQPGGLALIQPGAWLIRSGLNGLQGLAKQAGLLLSNPPIAVSLLALPGIYADLPGGILTPVNGGEPPTLADRALSALVVGWVGQGVFAILDPENRSRLYYGICGLNGLLFALVGYLVKSNVEFLEQIRQSCFDYFPYSPWLRASLACIVVLGPLLLQLHEQGRGDRGEKAIALPLQRVNSSEQPPARPEAERKSANFLASIGLYARVAAAILLIMTFCIIPLNTS